MHHSHTVAYESILTLTTEIFYWIYYVCYTNFLKFHYVAVILILIKSETNPKIYIEVTGYILQIDN